MSLLFQAISRPQMHQATTPVVIASSRFSHQSHTERTVPFLTARANPALNPVRFALWTLRDKAAQRRLALRWATQAAMFRSATISSHGVFSASAAAILRGVADQRSLSYLRPCSAPPHGGSFLQRFYPSSAPATVLVSPLNRCRMRLLPPVRAKFSVLAGGAAVRHACAKSHPAPFFKPQLSIVPHTQAPNPAVNRTPNKRSAFYSTRLARRRLLLR